MISKAHCLSACTVLLAASGAAFAAPAPVGLTVYAEVWNPAQPNAENIETLENSPTLVSDTLNSAWTSFRGWYLGNVPQLLAGADYLHSVSASVPSGITLYSGGGDFHKPPEMTLALQPQLQLVPRGANAFTANFHIPDSSISLCATTPSIAGKYADPCAKFTVDMNLNVSVQISDTPGKMLQVTAATVSLANLRYTPTNLPADVAVIVSDVIKFFGGPDYQAMMVKTIDSQQQSVKGMLQRPLDQLDARVQAYEQAALKNVNQQLGAAGSLDRLVHLAVWARSSAASQMLTVLLAPPPAGLALNPASETAQFSGTMQFDDSVTPLPASCADYNHTPQITGQVQTGPRPVIGLDAANKPIFGNAPMQPLTLAFAGGALSGRTCPYSLGHLAVGLPNILNFSNIQTKASGMPSAQKFMLIQPQHWSSPVVLAANGTVLSVSGGSPAGGSAMIATTVRGGGTPQTLNLTASIGTSYQQGQGLLPRQAQIGKPSPGDPVLDPQAKAANAAATVANPAAVVSTVSNRAANPVAATAATAATATTATPAAAAPSWSQPAGAAGAVTSSTTSNSSIRRGATSAQQPGVQQSTLHTAPSSLGR